MSQIIVYLTFNGNCAEAMTFYKECLGGELLLNKVGDSPAAEQCGADRKELIMHAKLTSGDLLIMASDALMQSDVIRGNATALAVTCTSEEEINSFYNALSAGGTAKEPLKQQFWGAIFGMCTDKFGIRWMLNFENSPS